MKIENEKMVSIHYTLKDDEGTVIDSSEGRDPPDYMHGEGHIIPGLEKALEGKVEGDELTVTVSPEEGYGVRDDSLLQVVEKEQFEGIEAIQIGMQFQVGTDKGPMVMSVAGMDEDNVTLDGNHPLADLTLHFEVAVAGVRDATAEELTPPAHEHGGGCGCG